VRARITSIPRQEITLALSSEASTNCGWLSRRGAASTRLRTWTWNGHGTGAKESECGCPRKNICRGKEKVEDSKGGGENEALISKRVERWERQLSQKDRQKDSAFHVNKTILVKFSNPDEWVVHDRGDQWIIV
jgi:hypothetical protein